MRRKRLLLAAIVFITACQSDLHDQEELPKGLLTAEQLVPIVAEMEVLQSVYNNRLIQSEEIKDSLPTYYLQVFEKFEIERTLFDSSYTWHNAHPDRALQLQEAVVLYLKEWEDGRKAKQSE